MTDQYSHMFTNKCPALLYVELYRDLVLSFTKKNTMAWVTHDINGRLSENDVSSSSSSSGTVAVLAAGL